MQSFRRFIIKVAEAVAYLAVVILTIVGAVSGWISALAGDGNVLLWVIIGAVGGFVVAAIFSAVFFLLVDIAENTRRT